MTLDMAAEWGIPPWEIAGEDPVIWYLRWTARRDLNIKAQEKKQEDG